MMTLKPVTSRKPGAPSRKAKVSAQSTAERILSVAANEFSNLGFAGARIEVIAKRAKITKQIIYYYFKNKEHLYASVVQDAFAKRQYYKGGLDALRAKMEGLNEIEAIHCFAEFMFDGSKQMAQFQKLIQDANYRITSSLKIDPNVSTHYTETVKIIEKILEDGARKGEFRSNVDPVEFWISMSGSCNYRMTNARTLSANLEIDLLSEAGFARSRTHAIDLLLSGIRQK